MTCEGMQRPEEAELNPESLQASQAKARGGSPSHFPPNPNQRTKPINSSSTSSQLKTACA